MNFKKFKKLFKRKKKRSSRKEKEKRKGIIPCLPCNLCSAIVILVLIGGIVFFGPGVNIIAELLNGGTTTTTPTTTDTTIYPTTTTTTDTTTTTTTTHPEDNFYKVKFSFLWGDNIDDGDKVWVEFSVHNYLDPTPSGRRDTVTLAAGHGDTGEWFFGSWDENFVGGEMLTVTMSSYEGWYDLREWPDIEVVSYPYSFIFYSYRYGLNTALTSELRITFELI